MLNVVSFKPPKFKPMPSELTPAVISGATLPVKIGIAQRAIAACCDLSELLTWKDKLAALAAAAKMARMPEMARDVNRVHKEAIFRMGEILLTYKNTFEGFKKQGDNKKSERIKAAAQAGISTEIARRVTRLASAPEAIRKQILQDDSAPANTQVLVRYVPTALKKNGERRKSTTRYSDAAVLIFSGLSLSDKKYKAGSKGGIVYAAFALRAVPCERVSELTPEEKQRARKLVIEMQEILDDIDRRLGPAS